MVSVTFDCWWTGLIGVVLTWKQMNAADSHEFRLEGGKLRYVHTMTECGGKRCSL